MTIQNDDLKGEDLYQFLDKCFRAVNQKMKAGASIYVACPPSPNLKFYFEKSLLDLDLVRHSLVWVKSAFVFGRSDYHYQHEDILFGWKAGAPHYFCDDKSLSTFLQYNKPKKNDIHPTMKPVDLVKDLIQNSSRRGERVLDPFGGSGTTLMASEITGRIAFLIEKDPRYCDAIRTRWAKYAKENGKEI